VNELRVVKKTGQGIEGQRDIISRFGEAVERQRVRAILQSVRRRTLDVEEGLRRLQFLPFEDLGFARVDHHRALRRGFPEMVFGEGKTVSQINALIRALRVRDEPVIVTRTSQAVYRQVRRSHPRAVFHSAARAIVLTPPRWHPVRLPGVTVVAAGTSDIPVAEEAALMADLMGNEVERIYDVGVAGLHRLLAHRDRLLDSRVLIVAAGMEGALPSVVAGLVDVPVIAVPTSVGYGGSFGGVAALLCMLNSCAGGVLVVNIDGGFSAGLSAGLINRAKGAPPRSESPGNRVRISRLASPRTRGKK